MVRWDESVIGVSQQRTRIAVSGTAGFLNSNDLLAGLTSHEKLQYMPDEKEKLAVKVWCELCNHCLQTVSVAVVPPVHRLGYS